MNDVETTLAMLEQFYAKHEREKTALPAVLRLSRALQPAFVKWLEQERQLGTTRNEATTAVCRVLPWLVLYASDLLASDGQEAALLSNMMAALHTELAEMLGEHEALGAMETKGSA